METLLKAAEHVTRGAAKGIRFELGRDGRGFVVIEPLAMRSAADVPEPPPLD